MSTISNLLTKHSNLDLEQIDWLQMLVGDWQVISDLAFADLVLWAPVEDGQFMAVAQCRPSTGATVHHDDIVGTLADEPQRESLAAVHSSGTSYRSNQPRWYGSFAVREEAIPVIRDGVPLAVLARQTNLGGSRTPSRLELNYIEAADDIIEMITRGDYPYPQMPTGQRRGAPRVADGLLRIDEDGRVLYASPNALSAFHRIGLIGPLVGVVLAEAITTVVKQGWTVDEAMPLVMMGRAPWRTDLEGSGVSISLRALPLFENGERLGAVLLCRDVSELRRQERALITKDATIREIHHRVKNNLQTVAALLRLQARRVASTEAQEALSEAMRRVATIALVHETLSQTLDETVEFDELISRSLAMAADVATAGFKVTTRMQGTFGLVPAEAATALALVLTELVSNAVEHGLAPQGSGHVLITVDRSGMDLTVYVQDDGVGMPDTSKLNSGLGNQIVRTLVENELGGSITWAANEPQGTKVEIKVSLLGAGERSGA